MLILPNLISIVQKTRMHGANPDPLTTPPLRVLSFGAGAIGTYIGGSLAHHGHQVVFLERPEIAAALRQQGLTLEISGETWRVDHPLMEDTILAAVAHGPFDIGLFALKSYDTQGMLQTLQPFTGQLPPLLCLQNGVENEQTIAAFLGSDKVISGTVTSAIGRKDAGSIILERLRGSGVAAGHPLSARLAQAMTSAGLNTWLFKNAAGMKWSKLLTNLLANATSAILDMTPAEIFAHPGLCQIEIAQLRETLQVMQKQGIQPVDLPGTPVRLLAASIRWLPAALARPLLQKAVGRGRGAKMPSFHIDLHSGRGKSEVDYLNGAVVRAGERLGIPTPVNRLLNNTLTGLTNGEIASQVFARKPEALIHLL